MKKLTKGEEELMKLLWKAGKSTVSDLIALMPEPKPPHSTVSTTMRTLERKGFVSHETYGRTHAYFACLQREEYAKSSVKEVIKGYFDGSVENMLSFLVQEDEVEYGDLKKLLDNLEKSKQK